MNDWNALSDIFNTKSAKKIDPKAADNVLIAWPSIINSIKSFFNNEQELRILDYGCGTGAFANELHKLYPNSRVTGIDPANEMINKAIQNFKDSDIVFKTGDHNNIEGLYDLITSVMAFQFINDIQSVIKKFSLSLDENGLVYFVTFNIPFLLKKGSRFKLIERRGDFISGELSISNSKFYIYQGDENYYDGLFLKNGFRRIFIDKPNFTDEFKNIYPEYKDENIPEYLILGYEKI